ncbi:hypothetical protein [Xylophilus sp. GOD-11R]|uniref:hypothetical protein n=1 Tax=Xylophilus sp. GOD-11R TaxID=3089814 RepID=UPI00298C1088|nr:hypothetical protein [Xylophilus sp. GOD-11R]WPB58509.1 hypothetical protein R9X41_07675 [Xylophilus sp. GOD-11R]
MIPNLSSTSFATATASWAVHDNNLTSNLTEDQVASDQLHSTVTMVTAAIVAVPALTMLAGMGAYRGYQWYKSQHQVHAEGPRQQPEEAPLFDIPYAVAIP